MISMSDSLPSCKDRDLLSSVFGAILPHKGSGGPLSSISISSMLSSLYLLSLATTV